MTVPVPVFVFGAVIAVRKRVIDRRVAQGRVFFAGSQNPSLAVGRAFVRRDRGFEDVFREIRPIFALGDRRHNVRVNRLLFDVRQEPNARAEETAGVPFATDAVGAERERVAVRVGVIHAG